jgi:hypothetical protein
VGVLPFVRAWRAFERFDAGAAKLLAVLAASSGIFLAFLWKTIAWSLFAAMPLLMPSRYPHHGIALLVLAAAGAWALSKRPKLAAERVRVANAAEHEPRVRIGEEAVAELDEEPAETAIRRSRTI